MKTSSRISLQFAALTTILVLLFAILVNGFFFRSWYNQELHSLQRQQVTQQNFRGAPGAWQFKRSEIVDIDEYEDAAIVPSKRVPHLVKNEDNWLIAFVLPRGNKVAITNVTPLIERQESLLRLSLIMLLISLVLSYVIGRWFVRRSLRDVYEIADFVQGLDIDKLHDNLSFPHLPANDEINTIALSLNEMTSKVHHQVDTIKRFVSNVSHEFKTPLMVMRSQADVSLKSKKYKAGLQNTLSQVDHMNRLIDTLLQLENKEPGSMTVEDCEMEPLITSLTEDTSSAYTDKKINLTLNLLPNLIKKTHRGSLEIILRNLIDNAYKYTPDNGNITITADTHVISVADTGPGIAADQLDHIREPFRQADASKGQDHGLGLGLSLVHSLVTQLGWTIDVESSNQGTTFHLTTKK